MGFALCGTWWGVEIIRICTVRFFICGLRTGTTPYSTVPCIRLCPLLPWHLRPFCGSNHEHSVAGIYCSIWVNPPLDPPLFWTNGRNRGVARGSTGSELSFAHIPRMVLASTVERCFMKNHELVYCTVPGSRVGVSVVPDRAPSYTYSTISQHYSTVLYSTAVLVVLVLLVVLDYYSLYDTIIVVRSTFARYDEGQWKVFLSSIRIEW